ncbi:E3 ubiquitin ligase-like protein [Medicago truncatula]|uniref:RING-type E3 ubiquitin transferase n=2 Tax=Medicago truncatula TaxID=3880 RepID=A0A072VN81_MEDTR|nr:E3 ubiquitin ligase-like protein [Medicago truncatula]
MDLFFAGGVSYCLAAAAVNFFNRDNVRHVETLESIPRFNELKELEQLLDVERLPLLVAISGNVVSETPIKCEITGLRGVIVEEREERHYLQRDISIGQCKDAATQTQNGKIDIYWKNHSSLLSSNRKEVPWYLDDGTGRVLVVGARGGTDFVLPAGTSTFEKLEQTQINETSDHIQLIKVKGLKRIERVLPVGTALTVVGQASKDDDGTIRIQRPPKGPFYVSSKAIDEHAAKFVNYARSCEYTSTGLIVLGAFQIAARIYYLLHRRRRCSEL